MQQVQRIRRAAQLRPARHRHPIKTAQTRRRLWLSALHWKKFRRGQPCAPKLSPRFREVRETTRSRPRSHRLRAAWQPVASGPRMQPPYSTELRRAWRQAAAPRWRRYRARAVCRVGRRATRPVPLLRRRMRNTTRRLRGTMASQPIKAQRHRPFRIPHRTRLHRQPGVNLLPRRPTRPLMWQRLQPRMPATRRRR